MQNPADGCKETGFLKGPAVTRPLTTVPALIEAGLAAPGGASALEAVAARHGIDISRIRSRQVRLRDFQDFDHIVAMDGDNLAALRQIAPPGTEGKLSLLLDHVPGRAGQSVADPYFGGAEGFDATWADLVLGIDGLVPRLRG